MKDSKLIRLLKTFSIEELKEFEKFASSSYFNKGRNYVPFLKLLKLNHPAYSAKRLEKENLYKALYPNKAYKENVINMIASGVYSLAKDFIVHEKIKEMNSLKDALLIKELSSRNLRNEADSLIRTIETEDMVKEISADYFSTYELYDSMLYHSINYDMDAKIIEYTCKSYISSLRFFLSNLLANQRILNANKFSFDSPFEENPISKTIQYLDIEKLINFVNSEDEQRSLPIVMNYYYYLSNTDHEKKENYYKLKEMVFKYFDKMDRDLKKTSCIQLTSICLNNISKGKAEFHLEFSLVYKTILKYELYDNTDEQGYFSKRLFRAIIITSNSLNEIDWSENFVTSYIDKVHPDFRSNLEQNSMARIEFRRKNFEKSLYHAAKIEQKSSIDKLDAKNLIAKIYYETNSIEPLNSHLDSYKHLIRNLNLQEKTQKTAHIDFIKILQKLVKQENHDKITLLELKNKILGTNTINNRNWLLEKIEELEKRV
ncbi:MAG: hypothetical protein IT281_00615 [Ignavibacteria bacterium]|nr:hypothetical protein [Ignavibacteria bacterium]